MRIDLLKFETVYTTTAATVTTVTAIGCSGGGRNEEVINDLYDYISEWSDHFCFVQTPTKRTLQQTGYDLLTAHYNDMQSKQLIYNRTDWNANKT